MALNFKFPDVGEGIHEGKLVKWLVKEGDAIKEDAVIAEVETDKAVVEIPSPKTGMILKTYFKEGEVIKVGQTMVTIGEKGEPIPIEDVKAAPQKAMAAPGLATAQTERARSIPPSQQASATSPSIVATPFVRQRAKELGVDLGLVAATGPAGRIMPEDVEKFAKGGIGGPAVAGGIISGPSPQAQPTQYAVPPLQTDFSQFGPIEKVKIAGIMKRTSEVMSRSKRTAAHVTHFDEADITDLALAREKLKLIGEQKGIKVTFLPLIVRAVVAALKEHPKFNSSFDEANDEIIMKKYYNIGIAVDTPDGLVVPNIRGADNMDIFQLAAEISRIASDAKERKMKLDDLKGGTFTITNIGSIGGEYFTPIIYHPEVAILGIGKINDKPVAREGKVAVRKMLALSLSFDHRTIDGAQAARFVNDIITLLENPASLG
ncbi:MAG TPA: dihydrolipoamide acetyltransferase family protein [Candidatus Norongarragalinales archaeon]|nr:dihydrolipoamide acetyltransferase family protein [Candidatus Norongarragalinales archaeon]